MVRWWRRSSILVMCLAGGTPVAAQQWGAGSEIDLVRRAAAHRSLRDADSVLASWRAEAHGIVRFSSLTGEPPNQVERVLRADELRVDVYGAWPGRNKQVIVAWRDSSFLPNALRYHRDHLGIVANDFGGTIRIGDGDEVRDLIHPLSDSGLVHYQFSVGDTTTITAGQTQVRVVEVRVRPADPAAAGVVGTMYLDLDRSALVRFRFTFTPVSYRDATVEDITVTLDNSLREGARWLPWRQSIAIRRGNPLFDLPWRTIIRGDWQIDDYTLRYQQLPNRFAGAPIDGLRRPAPGTQWDGRLIDRLDQLPASDADIERAQREGSAALGGRLLDGLPGVRLAGGGVGDFLHVNRVQGITPALGARIGLAGAVVARIQFGVGLSDHRAIGRLEMSRTMGGSRVALAATRQAEDVGDAPVISSSLNSIGTLFNGADHGDYTLVERLSAKTSTRVAGRNLQVELAREWSHSVLAAFTAVDGTRRLNPALGTGAANVGRVTWWQQSGSRDGWTLSLEHGQGIANWSRFSLRGDKSWTVERDLITLSGEAGLGTSALPPYRAFVFGGRGSLLGVPDRSLGGRRMVRVEATWRVPVSIGMPRISSRLRVRLPSTLAIVAAAGVAGGEMSAPPWRATNRIEPVLGLRLDLWGPLLRLEGGVALRTGRAGVTFDLHPNWWQLF